MRSECKARDLATGKAGRATMRFNRLLMAGLMALICVGTAAASQLHSVSVTPKANTATVTLQTTGSFAHKEYRPDDHLMLIDLTGVTSDPSLTNSTAFNSAALKRYAISTYTNASGITVTRLELALGDRVSADVVDESDGLRILLTASRAIASAGKPAAAPASTASKTASAPAATAAVTKPAATAATKPAAAVATKPATAPAPHNTTAIIAKTSAPVHPAANVQPPATKTEKAPQPLSPGFAASACGASKIRSMSPSRAPARRVPTL